MSKTTDLKPCPFCGQEAKHIPRYRGTITYYRVGCINVGCRGHLGYDLDRTSLEDAIRVWNIRVDK